MGKRANGSHTEADEQEQVRLIKTLKLLALRSKRHANCKIQMHVKIVAAFRIIQVL
jgi:hypothetical protein